MRMQHKSKLGPLPLQYIGPILYLGISMRYIQEALGFVGLLVLGKLVEDNIPNLNYRNLPKYWASFKKVLGYVGLIVFLQLYKWKWIKLSPAQESTLAFIALIVAGFELLKKWDARKQTKSSPAAA